MSNYTSNQYVANKNNSWNITFDLVGENKKVLDIGCSSGNFGAELIKKKNCIVDGVDLDPEDIKLAEKKLRNTYVMNVESDNLSIIDDKYDVILMMDVIEHLVYPAETLRKIASLLNPKGELIFSVPNMAHISVRLDLLAGEMSYRKTGVLDDTHLHFYTENTLQKILHNAGFKIVKSKSATISYPKQLVDMKLKEVGLSNNPTFQKKIENTKGNIYQFIGSASHEAEPKTAIPFPERNPHEEHFLTMERAMNDKDERLAKLTKEIKLKDQHIANLEDVIKTVTNSKSYKLGLKLLNAKSKIIKR